MSIRWKPERPGTKSVAKLSIIHAHQRILVLERLLITLHYRTSDEWVRERIKTEFTETAARKCFMTRQRKNPLTAEGANV